jgi:uncharacterized NAD-dependent epimerase/dehydratase family protein
MNKLEAIVEQYPDEEILKADGFDDAVIGIETSTMRLIYSESKCIDILINDQGMDEDEAREYLDFNVSCAYVGEQTPIWCDDVF